MVAIMEALDIRYGILEGTNERTIGQLCLWGKKCRTQPAQAVDRSPPQVIYKNQKEGDQHLASQFWVLAGSVADEGIPWHKPV